MEHSLSESQLKSEPHKFCWQHYLPSGLDFKKKKKKQTIGQNTIGGIAENTVNVFTQFFILQKLEADSKYFSPREDLHNIFSKTAGGV